MTIDGNFFWKVFTATVASFGVVMSFWELIKKAKRNTKEAKGDILLKEKREEAIDLMIDNFDLVDYRKSADEQKEIAQKTDLMQNGMLALLRFRVNRLCIHIKEQGFMTIDEKLDLEDLYKAYENLGGNSRTHEMYAYTMSTYKVVDK